MVEDRRGKEEKRREKKRKGRVKEREKLDRVRKDVIAGRRGREGGKVVGWGGSTKLLE